MKHLWPAGQFVAYRDWKGLSLDTNSSKKKAEPLTQHDHGHPRAVTFPLDAEAAL